MITQLPWFEKLCYHGKSAAPPRPARERFWAFGSSLQTLRCWTRGWLRKRISPRVPREFDGWLERHSRRSGEINREHCAKAPDVPTSAGKRVTIGDGSEFCTVEIELLKSDRRGAACPVPQVGHYALLRRPGTSAKVRSVAIVTVRLLDSRSCSCALPSVLHFRLTEALRRPL
jgi:hypothetical protein